MSSGYDFLTARNELEEGLRFEQHGVLDTALVHYQRAAQAATDAALLSEAFRRQSSVHRTRCEWDLAIASAERAIASAREARLDDLHSEALSALAAVHRSRGDLDEAELMLEGALRLAHDERVRGIILQNLGGVAAEKHDLDTAQHKFVESYGCFRRSGYRRGEAFALNNYGRTLLEGGHGAQAARVLAQAVAIARDVEDEELVALATLNVAETFFLVGDLTTASHVSEALGYFNHTQKRAADRCLRCSATSQSRRRSWRPRQCYVRGMQLALALLARRS